MRGLMDRTAPLRFPCFVGVLQHGEAHSVLCSSPPLLAKTSIRIYANQATNKNDDELWVLLILWSGLPIWRSIVAAILGSYYAFDSRSHLSRSWPCKFVLESAMMPRCCPASSDAFPMSRGCIFSLRELMNPLASSTSILAGSWCHQVYQITYQPVDIL
ncbi:unnamed protein product [Urochloa humidicola]